MAASDSPTTVQGSQLGCFLFDFAHSRAFELYEKFTQSVAQITMLYHMSEDFLRLHFAVDQFKGMTWKWNNAV